MDSTLKRSLALFFQIAIVFVGIGALAFMLWEPHIEGRNVHATTFEIYFKDPFLAYVYLGSVWFFVALYRAFGLFGHVRQNVPFSQVTVDALRVIRHCAIVILGFVAGGVVFIIMCGDDDDRPPGIFMGFLVASAATIIGTAAAMFARNIQASLQREQSSRG